MGGGEGKKKMKGDGEGESEGTRKNDYGKLNADIKATRRTFIKTTAAFGAAVAGVPPYNLTDIADIFLNEDGELIMYPVIDEFKFEFAETYIWRPPFKRMIYIKPWGCNWNCRSCPTNFLSQRDMMSISISTDRIMDLLLSLSDGIETMLAITGGEPLLQKEEILKLIKSVKSKTNHIVMLETNGSLIEADFIDKANDMNLDGVVLPFYSLDDEGHRWYTGHSNKDTIKALKLLTGKFKGQIVVYIVLFSHIDMAAFENMCKFLFEINPNFVIQILCSHQKDQEFLKKYNKAKEIASNYFKRIDLSHYFSKEIKMIRYQIVEDETGQMNLEKKIEWEMVKEAMKYG